MDYEEKRKILEPPTKHIWRQTDEDIHKYRNNFQRDRDRILYSKSFRRLSGKTQVFLPISHDHIRNRLTHSLEVSQIARVTARNLDLNENLSEAISLGHDLGHTPFGHVGERSLNFIMNNCGNFSEAQGYLESEDKGFKHNLQSVRVCCDLEKIYPNIVGMNLTNFTLWGIRNHSKTNWKICDYFQNDHCYLKPKSSDKCKSSGIFSVGYYEKYNNCIKLLKKEKQALSFEGYVVEYSDEIAQRHHDVEDAYTMNILKREDIISKIRNIFANSLELDTEDEKNFENLANRKNKKYFIPYVSKFIVNLYNKDLIETSKQNLSSFKKQHDLKTKEDYENTYHSIPYDDFAQIIKFSNQLEFADKKFKNFIKNTILNSFYAQRMDGKGMYVIRRLFQAYITNPKQLHDSTIVSVFNILKDKNDSIIDLTKFKLGQYRNTIGKTSLRNDKKFQKSLLRAICDHIAGMTDNFVLSEYERLYGSSLRL